MSPRDLTHRIHELHEQSDRRRNERRHGPVRSEALQAIAIVEQVQERLMTCLESMREALPALQPVRRMDSGAWRLGLTQPLDPEQRRGRASRPYSRCEFTIEIDMERRRLHVACHATVFDRDLVTEHMRVGIDDLPWAELQDFMECACLTFAERWFAAAATVKTELPPPRIALPVRVGVLDGDPEDDGVICDGD